MSAERVLYTTGTFDLPHRAQLEFLKHCKQIVGERGRVIVGLTTDELAVRQKRMPVMTYQQRRDILVEFPFVDAVVAHSGQSKKEAHAQLHYTDLAIGVEYMGTSEYAEMEDICRVHYLPCSLNRATSSSEITARMALENAHKFRILSNQGPGGVLFLYDQPPEPVVLKALRISQREFEGGAHNTLNVYGVPTPPPRNWKKLGDPHRFPNLPGVSSMRELEVQRIIQGYPWATTLDVQLAYSTPDDSPIHDPAPDWSHINRDKEHPRQIYWLFMKYAGPTLHQWINEHEEDATFEHDLQAIVDCIFGICEELRTLGLIHGDIHSYNVCVQRPKPRQPVAVGAAPKQEGWDVSLIDWGWCTHRSFQLDPAEREAFEAQLETGFDAQHFADSMEFNYHQRPWFSALHL